MTETLFRTAQPRFISHRGFQPMAPENSLPSFAYAGYLHQWAIETDVRLTRDGTLVCLHDATVDVHYDGHGKITELSWAEASRMRIANGNRLSCLTDEQRRMPRFSEYLHICQRYGSIPFIELKTGDVEPVIHAVHAAGFSDDQVIMSSIQFDLLAEVRHLTKDMFIHWIFAEEERLEDYANLGNAGLSWNYPDPASCPIALIERTKKMGVRQCLRAGDSLQMVETMLNLGLDYIPTNCMHTALFD